MTLNGWTQILLYLAAVAAVTVPLGRYMAHVFGRERTWLDPVLRPLERLIYRLTGVDERHEMRWTEYGLTMLAFSLVSMLVLYALMRVQAWLPFNPQGLANVAPDLAFNTAASFTTNTNWQSYVGETTMSYLTQMAGLAYHNFVSAADGHRARDRIHSRNRRRAARVARQLLGGHDPRIVVGPAPVLCRRCSRAGVPGCGPEPEALRPRAAGRPANDNQHGRRRQGDDDPGHRAGDRTGTGGVAGNHQGMGHQWRWVFQRQQRPPVREPDTAVELPRDVRHLRDLVWPHLHPWPYDEVAAPRLGRVDARWRSCF